MPYHQPARLVCGLKTWYILFYQVNPDTGKRQRFRETYDINRIPDPKLRFKTAQELVNKINRMLPDGYPFVQVDLKSNMPISEAMEVARSAKLASDRRKTRVTYDSRVNTFLGFLRDINSLNMPVGEFDKGCAYKFLDWSVKTRGIGACTYNNYATEMRALFTELLDRQLITVNPFSGIKKKRAADKERRPLTDYEKKQIFLKALEVDPELALAIMFIYYTFIRPVELRRLRIHHIDFKKSIIKLSGSISKNKANEAVTIPDVLMVKMKEFGLDKYPGNYFVFGSRTLKPGISQVGHNTLRRRHSKILEILKSEGSLDDFAGIEFYSWKDTGASDRLDEGIDLLQLKDQLRHKSLETTQLYFKSFNGVIEHIKTKSKPIA